MNSIQTTDHFLSYILSLTPFSPITILSAFFLTLARLVPIVTLAPFLGTKNVPRTVKMMFAVALTVLFLPYNLTLLDREIGFSNFFVFLMLKEVALGFFLGFFSAIPFYIAQSAGSLIDHSRGASALQVSDPTTQSQTGSIGILYNYMLVVIFFSLGGPFIFFNAVATSYLVFPLSNFAHLAIATESFWKTLSHLLQQFMSLAVQLSAPALIGILLTDLFLGIANRLAPQVQVVFLGIPLKSWVGIALMCAAWGLTIKVLGKEAISWIKTLQKQLSYLAT